MKSLRETIREAKAALEAVDSQRRGAHELAAHLSPRCVKGEAAVMREFASHLRDLADALWGTATRLESYDEGEVER